MLIELPGIGKPALLEVVTDAVESLRESPSVLRIELPPLRTPGLAELVLTCPSERAAELWGVLDLLAASELGVLMPGLRDSDRASVLYLAARGDELYRLLIRIEAPGATAEKRTVLYTAQETPGHDHSAPLRLPAEQPDAVTELVAVLVRLHTMRAQMLAGDVLAAHSALAEARQSLAGLLCTSLAAGSGCTGWEGMDEVLRASPLGRTCQLALYSVLALGPSGDPAPFRALVTGCLEVAEIAAPAAVAEIGGAIDSYRRYLGIS